jgi:hypothetical protein
MMTMTHNTMQTNHCPPRWCSCCSASSSCSHCRSRSKGSRSRPSGRRSPWQQPLQAQLVAHATGDPHPKASEDAVADASMRQGTAELSSAQPKNHSMCVCVCMCVWMCMYVYVYPMALRIGLLGSSAVQKVDPQQHTPAHRTRDQVPSSIRRHTAHGAYLFALPNSTGVQS